MRSSRKLRKSWRCSHQAASVHTWPQKKLPSGRTVRVLALLALILMPPLALALYLLAVLVMPPRRELKRWLD